MPTDTATDGVSAAKVNTSTKTEDLVGDGSKSGKGSHKDSKSGKKVTFDTNCRIRFLTRVLILVIRLKPVFVDCSGLTIIIYTR